MIITAITKPGQYHIAHNMKNEDHIAVFTDNNLSVMAICDGAGALRGGGLAAEISSKIIQRELTDNFQKYYDSSSIQAVYTIAKVLTTALQDGKNNLLSSEMGTTIIAAAMDEDGRCICFHLGDGIILRNICEKNIWDVVSSPENGVNNNTTYLTMNGDWKKHLRFYRWKAPSAQALLLMTDGAMEMMENISSKNDYWNILQRPSNLNSLKSDDDFTIGHILKDSSETNII